MTSDVDMLWALLAGVLILLMAVGVIAVIEGFTRQRSVSSGVARHLGAVAGAICGSVLVDALVDIGQGGAAGRWLNAATAVLFATIALGALAERATFSSHVVIGFVTGAVLVPIGVVSRETDGFLASISIGSDSFVDVAAATVFSAAGWIGLVGATVIGPRRGWVGEDGHVRSIPGKSMATALGGAFLILAVSPGLIALPQQPWSDEHLEPATYLVLAAAIGALLATFLGWRAAGAIRTPPIASGAIAGVVAASGAPLELSLLRAVVAGLVGSAVVAVVRPWLMHLKIDDPAGIIAIFGAAGVVGSLIVSTSTSSLIAQLVGVLIVAAVSTVVAGLLFGGLRVLRVLRIPADVEVVGLDR